MISLDEALALFLLRCKKPQEAVELLHAAVRKRPALYCNGKLADQNFVRNSLSIHVEVEANTRWRAKVVPIGMGWEDPPENYRWEVDDNELAGLLPKRRRHGPKPRRDWRNKLTGELGRIGLKQAQEMENSDTLRTYCLQFLKDQKAPPPEDRKAFNAMIRDFLKG